MSSRVEPLGDIKHDPAHLTRREREVIECVLKGMSVPQIAEHLKLAPRTVGGYIGKIRRKLDTRNQAHLVTEAAARGSAI
jgi:DNA-binding CsgD family transcriptional regulator